jgi:hypothetical protein
METRIALDKIQTRDRVCITEGEGWAHGKNIP